MMDLLNPVVYDNSISVNLNRLLTFFLKPKCDAHTTSLLALHLAHEHKHFCSNDLSSIRLFCLSPYISFLWLSEI